MANLLVLQKKGWALQGLRVNFFFVNCQCSFLPKQPIRFHKISRASRFDQDKLDPRRFFFKYGRQTLVWCIQILWFTQIFCYCYHADWFGSWIRVYSFDYDLQDIPTQSHVHRAFVELRKGLECVPILRLWLQEIVPKR